MKHIPTIERVLPRLPSPLSPQTNADRTDKVEMVSAKFLATATVAFLFVGTAGATDFFGHISKVDGNSITLQKGFKKKKVDYPGGSRRLQGNLECHLRPRSQDNY